MIGLTGCAQPASNAWRLLGLFIVGGLHSLMGMHYHVPRWRFLTILI